MTVVDKAVSREAEEEEEKSYFGDTIIFVLSFVFTFVFLFQLCHL